ncbi:DUF3575 domain-containing protein [Cyclobacterium sp. 1_MG-2023]|uniref:DUF3575 domain-containing protein n=1 Tax=Cyclobacterium sp. 1_MG-2023 TaxID=3062681 RepID=UPI0026E307F3|nr:DUF3575 domain-containing protein [Cyclobacterium sp. 1_MG-2023]MDO6437806.1 DUF3575 domain-containing protein [Cyclobacterium sp. 1_MG-2023]
MKKSFLIIVMLFQYFIVNGQNKDEVKNNIYFTTIGLFEGTYERNINKKSSFGITGLYSFSQKYDEDVNFQVSPFYRRYFGKKYASGFFTEGFATLGSTDGKQLTDINGDLTVNGGPDVIDLSLGLSIGYKWVVKSSVTFEVLFGMGGNLFNADKTDHNIINRRAIGMGYRF